MHDLQFAHWLQSWKGCEHSERVTSCSVLSSFVQKRKETGSSVVRDQDVDFVNEKFWRHVWTIQRIKKDFLSRSFNANSLFILVSSNNTIRISEFFQESTVLTEIAKPKDVVLDHKNSQRVRLFLLDCKRFIGKTKNSHKNILKNNV